METVSPAQEARSATPGPVLARPLSRDESVHLDRLREWLHGDGTDARDAAALDARWARLLQTHPPQAPAPAGVAAAIGIAVGDLLITAVPGALWMMCPGPEGATPGVLLRERPNMPVLPVLDAHARWRLRTPEWTVDYVHRAAAHLGSLQPRVPTARPAPDTAAPADDAGRGARSSDEGATPAPAAEQTWTPRFVEEPTADPEPAAWTPTLVTDDGADAEPWNDAQDERADAPASAAWTPTFVTDDGPEAEPEPWTPTFVTDDQPEAEPEPWTPTFVTDDQPEAEPTPWTPTVVRDDAAWATPVTGTAYEDLTDPGTTYEDLTTPGTTYEDLTTPTYGSSSDLAYDAPRTDPYATGAVLPPSAAAPLTPDRGLPVTAHQPLTPEDLPHRPSERVQDLALRALELALERAVSDPAGCAPFLLVREGHDVEVHEFAHSDSGVAQAREAARSGGYTAAAIAWTSPADATRAYPRVVVDASSAGRPGLRVAHSFVHDAHGGREIGGPEVVGQSAAVL